MTRKRLKKLLMAVQGIERDKAEEISRVPHHKFREVIAAEARKDIQRQKEGQECRPCIYVTDESNAGKANIAEIPAN